MRFKKLKKVYILLLDLHSVVHVNFINMNNVVSKKIQQFDPSGISYSKSYLKLLYGLRTVETRKVTAIYRVNNVVIVLRRYLFCRVSFIVWCDKMLRCIYYIHKFVPPRSSSRMIPSPPNENYHWNELPHDLTKYSGTFAPRVLSTTTLNHFQYDRFQNAACLSIFPWILPAW